MKALHLAVLSLSLPLIACPSRGSDASSAASPPIPPPPSAVDPSCTLVADVRLFDGERVFEKTGVLVRDGKIAEVSPAPTARCAATVDGAGKTLLPGFIDAHTHAHSEADLASALRYGVTTELDMFGAPQVKAKLRTQARERADLSDFFSAGAGITSPGGHGTEYAMKARTVDGPSDVEACVEACVNEGSDYIKIIYTPDSPRFRSISRETLQASVEAAHRHHLLAVVHINTLRAAQDALEVGADGLMHLFSDAAATPAFIEVARSHRAFVVPTLSVHSAMSGNSHGAKLARDGAFASRLDAGNLKTLKRKLPGAVRSDEGAIRESVRLLHAAGVPLLAGTDAANAGTAHGASIHGELELLVAAGLTPVDALTSATSAPARAFGRQDRGRIARGLRADMVLVDGDPTHDILATRRIVRVWRGGAALTAMDAPAAATEPDAR
jgi:imidazolonepropionase-like amidohydrolase